MKVKLPIHRNSRLYKLLYSYFKNDTKVMIWFDIDNPVLNNIKPSVYLKNKTLRKVLENEIIASLSTRRN